MIDPACLALAAVETRMGYAAQDMKTVGTNGRGLGGPCDLDNGDEFRLSEHATPHQLQISHSATGLHLLEGATPQGGLTSGIKTAFKMGRTTGAKAAPAPAHIALEVEAALTLLPDCGAMIEAVLLAAHSDGGHAQRWIVPHRALCPGATYQLVGCAGATMGRALLARPALCAVLRGTRITLADGQLRPIDALQPGDKVMTQGAGPKKLHHVCSTTLRAEGDLAPIRIEAGTLGQPDTMLVAPDQLLSLPTDLWHGAQGTASAAEAPLTPARKLINGGTIRQISGGFVDYYHLVFRTPQLFFAEGLATPSLAVDARSRPALPDALAPLDPACPADLTLHSAKTRKAVR